mmetsp:Transcript_80148/g.120462  ORF Transcript_80148/g.120462 Transcript_80148/m.120462 type:complete len:137 (-) Transcript_80148:302-712(-)|eukprot:CAMPEP_0117025920 /NCGR_PEP_ID=MMETSP0472-20121206/19101_1 /TAXON_ID=693140 ORGANISM="Tiarina fusus, Strain LIS" /NCGR_SAMPLE_ID=MMETSP0472 /ASSEMBLY_ACC=CAM_ASM_000603 /LENGTH=136 /DNA_ID=CAMNT_0004732773 /DNA_START=338 /DNA_END=748 /DNA_ORIENTATION=-
MMRHTQSASAISRADKKKGNSMRKSTSKVSFDESTTKTIVVEKEGNNQNAIWYTKDDIKDFRKQLDGDTLESMGMGSSSNLIRKDVIRSILQTQNEHRAMGISDPKGLRQLSRACSKKAIANAITRAQQEILADDL